MINNFELRATGEHRLTVARDVQNARESFSKHKVGEVKYETSICIKRTFIKKVTDKTLYLNRGMLDTNVKAAC